MQSCGKSVAQTALFLYEKELRADGISLAKVWGGMKEERRNLSFRRRETLKWCFSCKKAVSGLA
jgi:hypothetical protein